MNEEGLFEGFNDEDPAYLRTQGLQEENEHCQPLPDFDPYDYDTEFMTNEELDYYEEEAGKYERETRIKDGKPPTKTLAEQSIWGPRKKALQGRKTFKTGPKAVLTDYEEHKLQLKAQELREGFQKLRVANNLCLGKKHYGAVQADKEVRKGKRPRTSDGEDEESSDDISDEDIFLAYKTEKLIIANADRPKFGKLKELHAFNFDEEVQGEDPDVYILILFYQDYIAECSLMESILRNLAPYYPYMKFMRARTDKILPDLEDSALPSFVVYKDKVQVWRETHVTQYLPPQFDDDDVVRLLTEANVLQQGLEWKVPTKAEFAEAYQSKNPTSRSVTNDALAEEDSDSFDI